MSSTSRGQIILPPPSSRFAMKRQFKENVFICDHTHSMDEPFICCSRLSTGAEYFLEIKEDTLKTHSSYLQQVFINEVHQVMYDNVELKTIQ